MAAVKEDGISDDPYEILGLSRNADKREIRKRYQELVKKVCKWVGRSNGVIKYTRI